MTTENIIILAVIIILGLILIKIAVKLLFRLLILLLVAGAVAYFIFFDKAKEEDKFILMKLQQKYCTEKFDSVKCQCIIEPLISDLSAKYTSAQIEQFSRDPVKTIEVMSRLISDNQKAIRMCLKEKNAAHAWEDFASDLKSLKLGEKINNLEQEIKSGK